MRVSYSTSVALGFDGDEKGKGFLCAERMGGRAPWEFGSGLELCRYEYYALASLSWLSLIFVQVLLL